jgi:hypothetical protein
VAVARRFFLLFGGFLTQNCWVFSSLRLFSRRLFRPSYRLFVGNLLLVALEQLPLRVQLDPGICTGK